MQPQVLCIENLWFVQSRLPSAAKKQFLCLFFDARSGFLIEDLWFAESRLPPAAKFECFSVLLMSNMFFFKNV